MATRMRVGGKQDIHSKTHYRFADPECLKKDLENQRRITRLQQVREKSSSLARHIREEVAAEQKRQLKNLEKTKKQELETWREHVVAKKCHDYHNAMFQVGAAHRAAQIETEVNDKIKQQRAEKIENCRRLAAKRSVLYKPTNILRTTRTTLPCGMNMEGRATAGTQTSSQPEKEKTIGNKLCNKKASPVSKKHISYKRKRRIGNKSYHNKKKGEEITVDSSSDCSESEQSTNKDSGSSLQKTPAVIMDVNDGTEDSMESCKRDGIEINDLHKATNRKFSRVVRSSSTAKSSDPIPSRPRFTKISDLVRRTDDIFSVQSTQQSQENTDTANISSSRPSAEPPVLHGHVDPVNRNHPSDAQKRSSSQGGNKVIDAGLNRSSGTKPSSPRQVNTDSSAKMKTGKSVESTDAQHRYYMYQMQQPPMDPMQMQQMPMLQMPPYIQSHPMYGPQMMPPFNMMPYTMPPFPVPNPGTYVSQSTSSSQVPVCTNSAPTATSSKEFASTSNTTGRVQFYDHNNKYFRDYKAPEQSVQINPQDSTTRNAMENARLETEMNQQREQEKKCLRENANERGKKALQREQVRRHCAELEEKLEALTQHSSQLLPRDGNLIPSHRFADLALRREQKMNSAMEEMLLRPAIVTCPEIGVTKHKSPHKGKVQGKSSVEEAINVGDPPNKLDDAVSTASCSSLLLDYVNDQSNQLRTELKGTLANTGKYSKLKCLLQRIEKIRAQLLSELEAGDSNNNGEAQKVIDSIRKERANINTDNASVMNQRELELQKKEELLEQRLRLFYKQQKKCNDLENVKRKKDDTPVEIIIKVKSDGTVKQYLPKEKCQEKSKANSLENKAMPTTKSPSKVSEKQPTASTQTAPESQRQNSIDSNSTAYRELPPVIYKNIKPVETPCPQPQPLHPVLAHYVDRLLGMSRSTIENLGVSSSDITTPSDSIINNPRNISSGPEVNETLIDNERVERVQAFIEENRCFVNELEDTLRSQQKGQDAQEQETNEVGPTFDEMWEKQWPKQQTQQAPQLKQKQQQQKEKEPKQKSQEKKKVEVVTTSIRSASTSTKRAVSMPPQEVSSRSTAQSVTSRPKTEQGKQNQATLTTRTTETQKQRTVETSTISGGNKPQDSNKECAARQMERYAELTENCTQRIAELTELITKVREEKQRLVEVTLTSASEGDRQSTEYFELPIIQGQEKTVRSRTVSERSDSHNTNATHSDALPLQKNKPTGASLDSGISISRPLTALGQEPPEAEPISLPPAAQNSSSRRAKLPPATIRRYSPQLAVEEQAHELSTITEVDTPKQSHMVCATPAAVPFPTLEEYAEEIQIDLSLLDADRSMRLQYEFERLMEVIKSHGCTVDYREFPSIGAYLEEITATTRLHVETDENSLQAEDIFDQMRLPNVAIREFPNRHEYVQRLLENEPIEQRELIDSASLESSDSLNIEAELRERQLLKSSFKRVQMSSEVHHSAIASSTHRESASATIKVYAPNESGIEPLSRSPTRIEAQLGNDRIDNLQGSGSRRQKDPKKISGCATSPDHQKSNKTTGGNVDQELFKSTADIPQDASQMGRSLNLREFLTNELLKHRMLGGSQKSSESSDDSLKSNFLQSIINSLSPCAPNTPTYGQATNGTNDRQKTSTPVDSHFSTQEKSGSLRSDDTQLFSAESRISAVDYVDHTAPVPNVQPAMRTGKSSAFHSSKNAGRGVESKRK